MVFWDGSPYDEVPTAIDEVGDMASCISRLSGRVALIGSGVVGASVGVDSKED